MRARLMALAAAIILIFLPLQPCWSASNPLNESATLGNQELPSALSEDDSFNDLPFEQLRQALREEVELDPKKGGVSSRSSKQYNLLIR